MKRAAILAILFALLLPVTALSQTRRRSPRKPRATTAQKTSDVVREGAGQLAGHIKNLTRFLYVLGGIANGIEQADASIRRNEASPAIVERIQRNKATVKQSLADVRAGLDKLELDFRTSPELNRYYTELAGVAAGAATAESQAAAGQFEQAGRTLITVVNRLTDVLLEMR